MSGRLVNVLGNDCNDSRSLDSDTVRAIDKDVYVECKSFEDSVELVDRAVQVRHRRAMGSDNMLNTTHLVINIKVST